MEQIPPRKVSDHIDFYSDNKEKNYRRQRINNITKNFFLHIHSVHIDPHSLKPTYTLGLGLLSVFLVFILMLSGLVLIFYYSPSVSSAYNSVKDIVFVVPGGRIIRNIHRWSAHGLVLLAFLHMLRVFYTSSYSRKRTTNWIIGICMLVTVLLMNFSGYLLPWDQLAYWAVTIGSNIAASPRELTDLLGVSSLFDPGGFMRKMLIGDNMVGQAALSRFFALHVFLLPMTLLVLTAVHIWRIRKDGGLSKPLSSEASPGKGTEKWFSWPVMQWLELGVLLFLICTLLILATFVDAPLLEKANPNNPENPAKSPWYFLGIQEMVSYSAFTGGVLVPALFMGFLISIPFYDREEKHTGYWFSGKKGLRITLSSFVFAITTVLLILWVYIDLGWLRDWFPGISQWWVMLFNPASLLTCIFVLFSVWIGKRTESTRMASISLFTAAITGLIVLTIIGIWFRGPNWEFFWFQSQWPAM